VTRQEVQEMIDELVSAGRDRLEDDLRGVLRVVVNERVKRGLRHQHTVTHDRLLSLTAKGDKPQLKPTCIAHMPESHSVAIHRFSPNRGDAARPD